MTTEKQPDFIPQSAKLKESMNAQLALLEEKLRNARTESAKSVAKEIIASVRKRYKSNIRQALIDENKRTRQIKSFLKMLNKQRCPVAEKTVRLSLFGTERKNLRQLAWAASDALEAGFWNEHLASDQGYKKQLKRIDKLKKLLMRVREFSDLKNMGFGWQGELFDYTERCLSNIESFSSKGAQGRPSHKEFYAFVYETALLYQKVTGEKFTIYRHKINDAQDTKKYPPITPGHLFVAEAVRWVHEFRSAEAKKRGLQYNDKNIYIACENAQKIMRTK